MTGVVLATAGYDHTIRFWEAASGTCNRTVKYSDSVMTLTHQITCALRAKCPLWFPVASQLSQYNSGQELHYRCREPSYSPV